ncbi:MAG: MBG domain-containing protein [Akkermansiaceae bacterium]
MLHQLAYVMRGLIKTIFAFYGLWGELLVAQSYEWKNVEVGGCGFVTGTVFHPNEAGLVYCRTDVGGSYRLDTQSNRWIPLNDEIGGMNNEFQHLGVQSIALDPNDANRVYIATGQYSGTESWKLNSRIYRSIDRGATWTYTTPGFKMAGNGEGRGTGERMVVDPLNGANLLVGSNNLGIWRSNNHGATWSRLTSFPANLTNLNFLLYAPASAPGPGPKRRLYAAVNTLSGQSFWYSDNNGDSWAEVPNHPGNAPGAEMMPLQGSFDAAGVFYSTWGDATGPGNYAVNDGVWKMSADGSTWTSILPPTGQGFFGGISADPRIAGHVIVSTLLRWWPGDEVYRSTDGGVTWSAALRSATKSLGNSPWATPSPHWMTDIEIDPHNSNRAIFNTGFGLFQTTNLAASGTARVWTFFNDGLEESVPLALYSPAAGPPLISVIGDYTGFRHDNLHRSPLRGALNPSSGSTSVITGAEIDPSKMIRQNSSTTLYSQDAAATWAPFASTPAPVINGHHRVILSADGQRLLWCPPNAPAYLSLDHGLTWNLSNTGFSTVSTSGLQMVSTLAGLPGTAGSTNATGGDARFDSPSAVALDASGIRYIADTGNHTIRRIVAGGGVNTLAGAVGLSGSTDANGTSARFNSPAGITVDAAKNVYISDTMNHTIRKITSTGVVTTIAGSPGVAGFFDATGSTARFQSPTGLVVDGSGNLYVCDSDNHCIRRITAGGVVTTIAGSPGISGNTNGTGNAARLNSPRGIAMDSQGVLFIADCGNHAIRRISSTGEVSTLAGLAGNFGTADATGTAARFHSPRGIAIDAGGNLFVADTGNHTIRKITSNAVVTTVAGMAGASGTANGLGNAARFHQPIGIAVSPDGLNFYIADTGNHAIRRNYRHNTLTPIADRVDGNRFHLWDNAQKRLLTSTDGGQNFSVTATGVNSAFVAFRSVPGQRGHLWARAGSSGMYRSTNDGATFTKIPSVSEVYQFDFGKPKPGSTHPTVFIWGKVGTIYGFFRSDDIGATWVRINDNTHQFGYQNDIAGDPRVYGRVYLATSGRGVIYGDLATSVTPASQSSQMVYTDALGAGWTNASPVDTSLTATSSIRSGTQSISIAAGNGKGLALTCGSRSLEGIAALAFWINAGNSLPPPLQVGASRGGIMLEASPISVPSLLGWQRIVVPFADLGISNITDLTGLRIESRTVGGVIPGAFFIDDVELIGLNEFNGVTTATIALSNLSQTYNGTPRPITATTAPPGLPLLISYNGSSTVPTAAGSYAISAVIDDPQITGSATGTLVISKVNTTVILGDLSVLADGNPKLPTVTTVPAGVGVSVTYNGSLTPPSLAGSYAIIATVSDPNYQGSATGTLLVRQPALQGADLSGWVSNIPGKVLEENSLNPVLIPDDTTNQFSTNTLQARFPAITLANTGDQITVTGNFQLSSPGAANIANWFRFGLFDNRDQASGIASGWLGVCGMASPATTSTASIYERTGATGWFSTGTDATQRQPDSSPTPSGSNSPNPAAATPCFFENTITRTANGVLIRFFLKRSDNHAVLMSYSYTDNTPNNNGLLTGAQNTSIQYTPKYNTVGFAFARSYIGNTGARAQFSDVKISFTPAIMVEPQTIRFDPVANRRITDPSFLLQASASSGLPVSFLIVSGPASLSGNQISTESVGSVTVRAYQAGGVNHLAAPSVDRTFSILPAPDALENWRFEHFGTYDNAGLAANDVDADSDGEPNLIEFATGQQPLASSRSSTSMMIDGETILFSYTRSRAAREAGIMYDVEYHDTLDGSAWISTGAGAVTAEGPLESVEAIIPMSAAKRRFVRLRVSTP